MTILSTAQRAELVSKQADLNTTLTTYSAAAFQASLVTNLADAMTIDAGIEELYDKTDINIIRAYENERTALDARPILRNISGFYTGELDNSSSEILAVGQLTDNYLENIITPGVINISERTNANPSLAPTIQIDPDNQILNATTGLIDSLPSNVRRLFPQSGNDIRRITQFNTPANRLDDRISPFTWVGASGSEVNEPIVSSEKFFLFYEGRIDTFSNGGQPTNTASFVRTGTPTDIGTALGVIRSYTLTATAPTPPMMGSATNTATAVIGQQFLSDEGDRVEVLVGGTATTTVTSGTGGGTTTVTDDIVCGVLNTSQTAQATGAQRVLLNIEQTQLALNQDQVTNDNATARTNVTNRLALLNGGSGTDRATRVTQVNTRISQVNNKIGDIPLSGSNITGSLSGVFNMRYDFANQRANFATGTIGAVAAAQQTRNSYFIDTATMTEGTEITRLRQEIQDLQDALDFNDNFVP